MKTCLCLCLSAVLGGLLTASAQMPVVAPHPHSLSLTVEPVRAGSTTQIGQDTHKTNSDSQSSSKKFQAAQTQKTQESAAIQVNIRNFGQLSDTAQVEWYFISSPVQPDTTKPLSDQQTIFDSGSQSITLAPGATQAIPVESKEISSQIERHNKLYASRSGRMKAEKSGAGQEVSGSKMEGWIVRVVADGKVIDARASKDSLTEVAKDDAKLKAMKD